ncbi:MAG: NAD(P)(+) transhydrogenase (Re/Si-specific) subunit beta [Planctomycetes bacterium]|nr:NAD(P)(+) transhydrogenase (Re/Si-specific) subunit beta [Planctomycetota bacterium]
MARRRRHRPRRRERRRWVPRHAPDAPDVQEEEVTQSAINVAYLAASVCFIVGLKMLSSVKTAKAGNLVGSVGMLLAIVATLLDRRVVDWPPVIAGLAAGSLLGTILALKVRMTGMPQMVGLLNGFGGAASALVASAELMRAVQSGAAPDRGTTAAIAASIFIGWITFTGSAMAFAKLQGLVTSRPIVLPLQKTLNAALALACIALAVWLALRPGAAPAFWILSAISLALGVTLVNPIGGADMPVVISLLNSYSGMAACATGFALGNSSLIITGALVGASGIILTQIMCKAMNRSLANVMFAAVGATEGAAAAAVEGKSARAFPPEDVALAFEGARQVVVVPGYGMAVSQAQHAVRELADVLAKKGVDVKYAIHPVAGRMPGHMNVLLAEANVPYDQLLELDASNSLFPETDVALVVGANDITNPAARTNKASPIYGMPILDVDRARAVVFCKRSLGAGFAGVDNELFFNPKTMMLLGDAKDSLKKLVAELKK